VNASPLMLRTAPSPAPPTGATLTLCRRGPESWTGRWGIYGGSDGVSKRRSYLRGIPLAGPTFPTLGREDTKTTSNVGKGKGFGEVDLQQSDSMITAQVPFALIPIL
jgi:hypothetical protein